MPIVSHITEPVGGDITAATYIARSEGYHLYGAVHD